MWARATGGILPGTGTPENPYLVSDYADLANMATYSERATYRLVADIDASPSDTANADSGFRPIQLRGSLHGGGHVIRNLSIRGYVASCGLFSILFDSSIVDSLGLEGGSISCGSEWVGALVGLHHGSVIACHSTINVTADSGANIVGGLVGYSTGLVQSSWSSGSVVADTSTVVGGLVGHNYQGIVRSSHSTGNVSSKGAFTGGLIGIANDRGIVDSCYATGDVTSTNQSAYLGGLVGFNAGSIRASHANGAVSFHTGGGSPRIGGLVGDGSLSDTVEDCYATGSVEATSQAGGLYGTSHGSSIRRCYATGSVFVSDDNAVAGGLVGGSFRSNVVNCYATGSVTGQANTSLGGLVGLNTGIVDTSYSTGRIVGGISKEIGALVGNNDSLIFRSYWNTESSGQGAGVGSAFQGDSGIGLSSAQMQVAANFAGWDFQNTWILQSGDAAPRLRSLAASYGPSSVEASPVRRSVPYSWILARKRLTISVPGRSFQAVAVDLSGRVLAHVSGAGTASMDLSSSQTFLVSVRSSDLHESFSVSAVR